MAVGFILFLYMLLSAYSSYASSAYYASVKADLMSVARAAASDPLLSCSPGVMDAHRLDNASSVDACYGYPGSAVEYTVEARGHSWRWGESSRGRSASCTLPVSVRLNDARCVPGTLKVTMWEG
ncbi:DUF7285 family protein [Methanocella conradii]|uniref:DUF7285 family protein n=1 Tax=Methanocella conradii TaxID=1175444 RepID=UPI0020C62058|nr:hypothetical protein [Methanocella conradii]